MNATKPMSLIERVTDAIPSGSTHVVAGTSLVAGGLATKLVEIAAAAEPLAKLIGLGVVCFSLLGAGFYAAYWGLKLWAKWRRIQKGDYAE